MVGRNAWALAVGLALAAGCTPEEPAATPDAVVAPDQTSVVDTVTSDATTTMDTAGPEDTVAPPQEFEIGVNVTGRNTAEYYTALPEGGDLTIEYGPQGLWMVVLAFRTRGIWQGNEELFITASCWIGDENRGELTLAKQRMLLGPDGWWYYYNLFLVVDEVGASGNDGRIELSVSNGEMGQNVSIEHPVALVGGP